MADLALRCRSVWGDRPYTAPGLGDRIHSVTVAWCYGQAHGEPVTLHVTRLHMTGGQFGDKPQTWQKIVSLFPKGSVAVKAHDIAPSSDKQWAEHLGDVAFFCYGDHPGPFERAERIDIAPYLQRIPLLEGKRVQMDLPERFVTAQWDPGSKNRRIPEDSQRQVLKPYPQVVTVGGAGTVRSIEGAAYAMSKAEAHIGVDSAFFHLAQLYLPPERIHVCYRPGAVSHHVKRAMDIGIDCIEFA